MILQMSLFDVSPDVTPDDLKQYLLQLVVSTVLRTYTMTMYIHVQGTRDMRGENDAVMLGESVSPTAPCTVQ